jgi:hypothetical protein
MIVKFYRFFLLFVVSLALTGCGVEKVAIQERQLPQRNPTAYEFDAPIDAVKHAINEARGEKWRDAQNVHEGGQLAWKGDGNPFAKNVFTKKENENDAYLSGMGYAVGKSQVYLKDGKELTYYADFQIHLTPISVSKTRVEIFTQDGHVQAGTEWHPFARAGIFVVVEPTSIEEYQILSDIGKQLGVQDMPKLKTPDTNSPTRELKAARRG